MPNTLSTAVPNYDLFFLDLWGVIHDGSHLYPGVHDTLRALRRQDKKIIMISNAPRRASVAAKRLVELGVESTLYDHVVTSGEVGFRWLASGKAPYGKHYFFIGPERDATVIDGLDYSSTPLEKADFILNVGYGSEEQATDQFDDALREARKKNLPMLCLNPDLEVVKITGQRFPCAGVIGKFYEKLGGKVQWFGKPYNDIYEFSHAFFPHIPKSRILGVGDSLETDIPGAKNYGIDSMLITGGILKERTSADVESLCGELCLSPKYTLPSFT